jgi:hypothetical protein
MQSVALVVSRESSVGSPDSVTLQFELTEEEAIPVFKWQLRQTFFTRRMVSTLAVFAVAGIVVLLVPGASPLLGAALLGLAGFEAVLLLYVYGSVPGRAWKKLDADRGPTTLVFNDEGVGVQTKNTNAQNRWAVYAVTVERDGIYLLKIGKSRAFQPVPKRSFADAGDESVFRSLVTRHTDARLRSFDGSG